MGGGYPHFNWTEDSDNVIFYSDGKHMNYNVSTAKLSERPIIYSSGLFLLSGDKQFLAIKSKGYWIHNFDGKVVKKVDFKFPGNIKIANPVLSADTKTLFFMTEGGREFKAHWVEVESGKQLQASNFKKLLGGLVRPIFLEKPDTLFYTKGSKFVTFNLTSKEKNKFKPKEEYIWGMTSVGLYSLINHKGI